MNQGETRRETRRELGGSISADGESDCGPRPRAQGLDFIPRLRPGRGKASGRGGRRASQEGSGSGVGWSPGVHRDVHPDGLLRGDGDPHLADGVGWHLSQRLLLGVHEVPPPAPAGAGWEGEHVGPGAGGVAFAKRALRGTDRCALWAARAALARPEMLGHGPRSGRWPRTALGRTRRA